MLKYYKHYFKGLAISNEQIAHTDEEEAYFFVRDKYNPDAFDQAIRNSAKTPAMLLEPYSTKLSDGNSRNNFKFLQGRFNILEKVDNGDEQSIEDAQEHCESIAEDLLLSMLEDLGEGMIITVAPGDASKRVWFKNEDITIDQIGPICLEYYGVSVGFSLKTPAKSRS
jgi:hypothetical protein